MKVLKIFDEINGIKEPSALHSKCCYKQNMLKLVNQLKETSKMYLRKLQVEITAIFLNL